MLEFIAVSAMLAITLVARGEVRSLSPRPVRTLR